MFILFNWLSVVPSTIQSSFQKRWGLGTSLNRKLNIFSSNDNFFILVVCLRLCQLEIEGVLSYVFVKQTQ